MDEFFHLNLERDSQKYPFKKRHKFMLIMDEFLCVDAMFHGPLQFISGSASVDQWTGKKIIILSCM
jgi:hypothetical protein